MQVLIAEDEPISRRLLQSALERLGHDVVAVSDGDEAVAALVQPDAPQLAILDWMMPAVDGLKVCRAIRERTEGPYVYLILLTAREGREHMIEALEAGADDFLTKPFDISELGARVKAGARVIELQDGLLRAQERLRVEATRDDLTGLWNRRMILDQLRRELRRAVHEQRPVAVVLADVDRFKAVNDEHGHGVGDEVLKVVGRRMRSVVRDYDCVGRYGGEEFLVVLSGCDGQLGTTVAERIRQKVTAEPVQVGDLVLPVTLSLGLAWTNGREERPAVMVEAADRALYRAKSAGRNCVEDGGER